MDFVLVVLFAAVILAAVIYVRCNRAKILGRIGEWRTSAILKSLPDGYYLFDDVYLKSADVSVQVDHIVVSVYGIFVVETKNYTGWIYGSEKSEEWTKNMYGHKYRFQNPLKQNRFHVKALQGLLELPEDKFVPIVVFMGGATLKGDTRRLAVYASRLRRTIRRYDTPVLDEQEVIRVIGRLSDISFLTDKETKKEHVKSVRKRIAHTQTSISSGICPRCGGKLVERKGGYGRFLGCSNYPRCKFTRRI